MDDLTAVREIIARVAALSDDERRQLLADHWEMLERVKDNAGPELTDEEWDELDEWYNAQFTSAATNRS